MVRWILGDKGLESSGKYSLSEDDSRGHGLKSQSIEELQEINGPREIDDSNLKKEWYRH